MKRSKTQKGITLVALIITVIVLLILAVTTIQDIQGDGIIAHAKNAKSKYLGEKQKEEDILSYYDSYLGGTIGKWVQTGTTFKKVSEDGSVIRLQVGDKIVYNEGIGYTSEIDSNFKMEDLEWRVLGLNDAGQIELISIRPTKNKLALNGERGWISAEENLDKLCNDLYGHGIGANKARSLKTEDINKLGGYHPTEYKEYNTRWQYQYSTTVGNMQSRKSIDNGTTWSDWKDIIDSDYQTFKEPEGTVINSSNTSRIANLTYTYYQYDMKSYIKDITSDGIDLADLICRGLNDDNTTVSDASGSANFQWLSSRCVRCLNNNVEFMVHAIGGSNVGFVRLYYSNGQYSAQEYGVRPVVTLSIDVQLTDENGDGVLEVK